MASVAYPYDVGSYHQAIETKSPEAQTWFNRGWVWLSAYHREEAAFCFGQAAAADPGCAMAHWGLALAHGPDYNFHAAVGFYDFAAKPEGWPSLNVAHAAVTKAVELCAGGPPRERALVSALALRYEWPVTSSTPGLQEAYADAMERTAIDFPEDADIQAVSCEAILILRPWDLYDKPPGSSTPPWHAADKTLNPIGQRVAAALERGLKVAPAHAWLCHLRIHMNEMGPIASIDWEAADTVRRADAADCGHLIHMPSHVDFQVGDYARAISDNVRAYRADLKLFAHSPARFTIYTGYLIHNMEFCAWAAMYAGAHGAALEATAQLDAFLSHDLLSSSPAMPMMFELYLSARLMVLVRFGRWDEVLATPFKQDAQMYQAHTLMLHFARGIALGALSRLDEAKAAQASFVKLWREVTPADRRKHNVTLKHVADLAERVLQAELFYREANHQGAFEALGEAIALFDELPYDEPHGYLMSPRQTLGALLTEQGEYERAIGVYDEDLLLFPKNPWALAGLQICCTKTSSPRLASVTAALELARAAADTPIGTSCACALRDWSGPHSRC